MVYDRAPSSKDMDLIVLEAREHNCLLRILGEIGYRIFIAEFSHI